MTYLEPLHVLPFFEGDQRITHKVELSPHSHYIIKMNKNEMIRNLEEENIIMKYGWHSHKHSYTNASRSTWMLIITKRESRKKKKTKVKTNIKKKLLFIVCRNDGRKEEVHRCHSQHKPCLLYTSPSPRDS